MPSMYEELAGYISKKKKVARKFFRNLFLTEEEATALQPLDEEEETGQNPLDRVIEEDDDDEGEGEVVAPVSDVADLVDETAATVTPEAEEKEGEDGATAAVVPEDAAETAATAVVPETETKEGEDGETAAVVPEDAAETAATVVPETETKEGEDGETAAVVPTDVAETAATVVPEVKAEEKKEEQPKVNAELIAKLNEKIKLKTEEIERTEGELKAKRELQATLSKEALHLEEEGIKLKKEQIRLKKLKQPNEEELRTVDEQIKLNDEEIKLNERETRLAEKEIKDIEQSLEALRDQLEKMESESEAEAEEKEEEQSEDYDENHDEDYGEAEGLWDNEIPQTMQEEIISRLNSDVQEAIRNWNETQWKKYKKSDLVNLFMQLHKRRSILLQDEHIGDLTVDKLILLIHQSTSSEEDVALTREEVNQYVLEQDEETKALRDSRVEAAVSENMDDEFYDNLITTLSVDEDVSFFETGASTEEDSINKIAQVADLVSGFRLIGNNPMAQFKKDIKQLVSNAGPHLAEARKMAVSLLSQINTALTSDPNLSAPKNRNLKRYYNIWLRHLNKESVEEFTEDDIDAVLSDEKCEYLSAINDIVKTMLDKLWESGYNAKKDKVELSPKSQTIFKYFSEFLNKSEELIQPMRAAKSERMNAEELKEIEFQNKHKTDNDEEYPGLSTPRGRKSDKKAADSEQDQLKSQWQDLRLKGIMSVLILVEFYNKNVAARTEKKKDFKKLRDKMVNVVLQELKNNFSINRPVSKSDAKKLSSLNLMFKDIQEQISGLIGSDEFDERIKQIEKNKPLIRKLKLPRYELPDFAE